MAKTSPKPPKTYRVTARRRAGNWRERPGDGSIVVTVTVEGGTVRDDDAYSDLEVVAQAVEHLLPSSYQVDPPQVDHPPTPPGRSRKPLQG